MPGYARPTDYYAYKFTGIIDEYQYGNGVYVGLGPTDSTPRLMFAPVGAVDATSNWQIDVSTANSFRWFTPGVVHMSLKNKSLAIGLNSPPSGVNFTAQSSATTNVVSVIKGMASQTGSLTEWRNSSDTVLAKVDSSGNFGIGTNTPAEKLSILSNTGTALSLQVPTGGYNWLNLNSGYTGALSIGINDSGGSGAMGINQYNSSGAFVRRAVTIDSTGKVGIGISAPASTLHVHGGNGITFTDGNNGTSMAASAYSIGYNMIGPNAAYTSWAINTPSGVGMGVAVNESASTVELYARNNGTQMYQNGQLRFNAGGQITMANQPAFRVGRSSGDVTGPAVIVFNEITMNRGSNYSTTTGRFTAPVAGIYSFDCSVMWNSLEPKAYMRVNGTAWVYDYQESHTSYAGWWHNNLRLTISLAAGDYVDVYNYGTTASYGTASIHTWFSGYLLG